MLFAHKLGEKHSPCPTRYTKSHDICLAFPPHVHRLEPQDIAGFSPRKPSGPAVYLQETDANRPAECVVQDAIGQVGRNPMRVGGESRELLILVFWVLYPVFIDIVYPIPIRTESSCPSTFVPLCE